MLHKKGIHPIEVYSKKQLGLEKSWSLVQPISVGRGLLLTVSFNKVVIFRFEEGIVYVRVI